MDLSKCKLISVSRSRIFPDCSDYKYWQSSVVEVSPVPKACETVYEKMQRLAGSKSVPRLNQFREKPNIEFEVNALRKKRKESSTEKKISKLSVELPNIVNGERSRTGVRPNKFTIVKRQNEIDTDEEVWTKPPEHRYGLVGAKLTRSKKKLPVLKREKTVKKLEKIERSESSEGLKLFAGYRELYIQKLLEKKVTDFKSLFDNPIDIV